MTQDQFTKQVSRLRSVYGEKAYPDERGRLFFLALRNVADDVFDMAVTECIAHSRSAPMLKELTEAVVKATGVKKEQERQRIESRDLAGVLKDAATKAPNREFAAQCVKLLMDYTSGRITKAQFNQGCDYLDEAARLCS